MTSSSGYVAGLALFAERSDEAATIAALAAPRTTNLAATLLRHAARSELPEPAHALLDNGDPWPLRHFGATSGTGMLVGLALALGHHHVHEASRARGWKAKLRLPGGMVEFDIRIASLGTNASVPW